MADENKDIIAGLILGGIAGAAIAGPEGAVVGGIIGAIAVILSKEKRGHR